MSIGVEDEFREIEGGHWNVFHQEIQRLSSDLSFNHAKLPENKGRNRYRDVSPFDHSRICLRSGTNDYINASLIFTEEAKRRYILTQGPLPATCGHFWEMVWEQRSRGVVMLNRIIELGSVKCTQYWPPPEIKELLFRDAGFRLTLISEDVKAYCIVRQLELENLKTRETREILHFHYTAWPDYGVPSSPDSFLFFLMKVRESGCMMGDQGPIVVHCSAGIGRSGVFCLVDTCLLLMCTRKDPLSVCVRDVLLEMRQYRMGLVQTAQQLRFSYLAIIEGAKALLRNTSVQEAMKDLSDEEDVPLMFTTPLRPSSQPSSPPPRPPKRIGMGSQDSRATFNPYPRAGEAVIGYDYSCSPDPEPYGRARHDVTFTSPVDPPMVTPTPVSTHCSLTGLRLHTVADQAAAHLQKRTDRKVEASASLFTSVYMCAALAVGAYICYRAHFH
ncbi:hypothetical protein JZ751_017934 [Albula glossodonta]|uniref:Tyrosine-protein phosphatase non-receptor type n=1 Tax=Albula glossodonta TaxID=121402 RepID=A0A8T2PPS0_9TELE|nr:hypothetical protein JZ751_017934 [Albula glossodonta]